MIPLLSKIKVFVWRITRGQLIHLGYWKSRKERLAIDNILSSEETVSFILSHPCSVACFGDGEFQMIEHGLKGGDETDFGVDSFQPFNSTLAARLYEVLLTPRDNLLVCIPYPMIRSGAFQGYERIYFEREWLGRKKLVMEAAARNPLLGDAAFTRFYMHRKDIDDYPRYIASLKQIWDGKEVILVEGEKSRLGIGNDLFDNVKGLNRIICPATNAFAVYDQILSFIDGLNLKDRLYLLALGHSATVLAYDLNGRGFRAIDLGHIDIEYEWFLMKAKEKCPIPDKYVNEVAEGRILGGSFTDRVYENQIIKKILIQT